MLNFKKYIKTSWLRFLNLKLTNGKRLNWLLREIKFKLGYFEPEFKVFIASFVSKEDVFIDVGANIGVLSEYASRHCRHVLAFDPDRDCAIALTNKFYHLNNVLFLPFGVGSDNELLEFISTKGSGRSSYFLNSNHEFERTRRYLTFQMGIRELLKEVQGLLKPKRISVKLDLEGGEHFIIADICECDKVSSVYFELTEENRMGILLKLKEVKRKLLFHSYDIEERLYNQIDISSIRNLQLLDRCNIVIECL